MNAQELTFLFKRDLTELKMEILAYATEEALWVQIPGTINTGGNLCQHLIGNLRTYIGQALGDFPYVRNRPAEFSARVFTRETLVSEIDALLEMLPGILHKLTPDQWSAGYPRDILVIAEPQSHRLVLMHLAMHLAWHRGQINYHRRIVNKQYDPE
jgi:hypothetical protein